MGFSASSPCPCPGDRESSGATNTAFCQPPIGKVQANCAFGRGPRSSTSTCVALGHTPNLHACIYVPTYLWVPCTCAINSFTIESAKKQLRLFDKAARPSRRTCRTWGAKEVIGTAACSKAGPSPREPNWNQKGYKDATEQLGRCCRTLQYSAASGQLSNAATFSAMRLRPMEENI